MTLRVGCATVGSASSRGRFGPWPKERLADGGARGVARTHSCDEHGLTSRLLRVEGDKPTRVQPRNRFAERQRWLSLWQPSELLSFADVVVRVPSFGGDHVCKHGEAELIDGQFDHRVRGKPQHTAPQG